MEFLWPVILTTPVFVVVLPQLLGFELPLGFGVDHESLWHLLGSLHGVVVSLAVERLDMGSSKASIELRICSLVEERGSMRVVEVEGRQRVVGGAGDDDDILDDIACLDPCWLAAWVRVRLQKGLVLVKHGFEFLSLKFKIIKEFRELKSLLNHQSDCRF